MQRTSKLLYVSSMLAGFLSFGIHYTFAANIYHFKPDERIKGEITNKEMTRIEFGKYGIAAVIGDENKYGFLNDEEGSNIFIKPKVPVGDKFSISLISQGGLVQDLDLTVQEKEAEAIIVRIPSLEQQLEQTKLKDQEIADILKTMQKGERGKYYVMEVNNRLDTKVLDKRLEEQLFGVRGNKKIIITKKQIYRFDNITGVVLNFKNNTNKKLQLRSDYFNRIFEHSVAVSLEAETLPVKASTKILIVCREEIGK